MANEIVIKGAREHNLKDVDLTIPRDELVVITGLSGSGKSSLAFDTMYADAEAGSNLVESLRVYVACGGDANAAAERLCQHPNSVRNRVNRARAVLAMEDATDKQLFAYLSMIFL